MVRSGGVVERFRALERIFGFELRQRLHDLEAQLVEADWGLPAAADGEAVQRMLDSVASSATAFGRDELSAAARRLMSALGRGRAAADRGQRRELRRAFEELQEAAVEREAGAQLDTALEGGRQARTRRLLLLFEESPQVASELTFQLGCFGFVVRPTSEVDDLLLSLPHAAAVILDVDVQARSGAAGRALEAVAAHRRDAADPPPLLVIATHDDLAARLRAVRLGADAFLPRPLDVRDLIERLDVLVSPHGERPYQVLLVEDDHQTALAVTLALQGGGLEVTRVEPVGVLARVAEQEVDVVLADLELSALSGPELAAVIRQQRAHADLPVVYLCRREMALDRQLQAMRRGGDDLVVLPGSADRLLPTVHHHAQRHRIVRHFRTRDGLTGLLNFSSAMDLLRAESRRAAGDGGSLALALLDVDSLELLNEGVGHLVGDSILRGLAQLLRQRFRRSDGLGRFGNRFLVLMPGTSFGNALQILEDVRLLFAEIHRRAGECPFPVTLSCGLAWQQPGGGVGDLYHVARRAVERARALGGDRVETARE